MKPIRITVLTEEPVYGRALARGLAEQEKHFTVEIMHPAACENGAGSWSGEHAGKQNGPQKCRGVLVTDFPPERMPEAILEPYRVVWLDGTPVRASALAREILRVAEVSDRERYEENDETGKNTMMVSFRSRFGGSGVTSAALTAGRMLAGAYGERILYLPFTREDGSRIYRSPADSDASAGGFGGRRDEDRSPGSRELLYRMKKNLPYSIEGWTETDDYGLEYINGIEQLRREEKNQLLQHLLKCSIYSQILLDFGTENPQPCSISVQISSERDLRCGMESVCDGEEKNLTIHVRNHTDRGYREKDGVCEDGENILYVVHDEESFLPWAGSGRIEIVMSKSYAIGIKKLAEILLEKQVDLRRTEANGQGL